MKAMLSIVKSGGRGTWPSPSSPALLIVSWYHGLSMEYDGKDFVGVKAALFWGDKLLIYQRDNKPGLRFAGLWDFFGGGREDSETPFECLRRELGEELEIGIVDSQVLFTKKFPAMHDPTLNAYFMVIRLSDSQAMDTGLVARVCGVNLSK